MTHMEEESRSKFACIKLAGHCPKGAGWTVQVQQGVSTSSTTTPCEPSQLVWPWTKSMVRLGIAILLLGHPVVSPPLSFLGEEDQGHYKRRGSCPVV